MIDKETWNVETDHDKIDKIVKFKMSVQYKKRLLFKKTFSGKVNQSTVFSINDSFLTLWINTPRPNWEIHMDWENDI